MNIDYCHHAVNLNKFLKKAKVEIKFFFQMNFSFEGELLPSFKFLNNNNKIKTKQKSKTQQKRIS